MIGKSGLLSILQFVALIIPAFAIFMQMIASQDIDETFTIFEIEVNEYKIFQYSIMMVVMGGALIFFKLLEYISDPTVGAGIALIFGSLPVTVVGIWILNIRESDHTESPKSPLNAVTSSISQLTDIVSLFMPAILISAYLISSLQQPIDNFISHGAFADGWIIAPSILLSIILSVVAIRALEVLSTEYNQPEKGKNYLIIASVMMGLGLPIVYLLIGGIPVVIVEFITRFAHDRFGISKSIFIYNISYLWSLLILYAVLVTEFNNNSN